MIYSDNADDPEDAEKLLYVFAGSANIATNNAILTSGSALVVLGPKHASVLERRIYLERERLNDCGSLPSA